MKPAAVDARPAPPAPTPRGRLVAVEATRGGDLDEAARRVWERLRARGRQGGISRWDASGTFYEARQVKKRAFVPSARTLLLFYAVDLQFRLKWEILPLLAEGCTVVAAPYVETARAFGRAAGVPRAWLDAVFAPVPAADVTLRAKERKRQSGWKGTPEEGFGETCAAAARNGAPDADLADLRCAMIAALERRERAGAILRVRKKILRTL